MKFHLESRAPLDGVFFVNDEQGNTVGELKATNQELAHLVGAASDLLAMLKAIHQHVTGLVAYLKTCSPDVIVGNLPTTIAYLGIVVGNAEAAIRKATEGL